MRFYAFGRRRLGFRLAGALGAIMGCGLGGQELLVNSLNPQFAQRLGLPLSPVPLAPGDEPFLVARVLNMTDQFAVARLSWEDSTGEAFVSRALNLTPGSGVGLVLECDVPRLTVGDVKNVGVSGVSVVLANNTRIEVLPQTRALEDGIDYLCGDLVIFALVDTPLTPSGYHVTYAVLDGSTQGTEFTGPDTFALLRQEVEELQASGMVFAPFID